MRMSREERDDLRRRVSEGRADLRRRLREELGRVDFRALRAQVRAAKARAGTESRPDGDAAAAAPGGDGVRGKTP